MKVIEVDPRINCLWGALIEKYDASVFHSPQWMNVLTQTYGYDMRAYIVVNSSEAPLGGIAFCHIQDLLGDRMVAFPFSDYYDPLVKDQEIWNQLVARICEEKRPITLRCLHNSLPLHDKRFTVEKKAKWHGLNLEGDLDSLWAGMHKAKRKGIRKASKHGVSVEFTSDRDMLEKFFQMHVRIRKYKFRLLAQPFQFFETIWRCFRETKEFYLLVAVYEEQIVAGAIFLGWRKTLYCKFSSSDPNYLIHCPNALIMWEAIKLAKTCGYGKLDFGLSDIDQPGLITFKRELGAQEKEITHMQYVPRATHGRTNGEAADEVRKLLGNLTDLITEKSVPDQITARAGEILYKFFS